MVILNRQFSTVMLSACITITSITACAPLPSKPQIEARGPYLVYYVMNQPAMQITHDSAVDCGVEARLEAEGMNAQALKAYHEGLIRIFCMDTPIDPILLPFKSPLRGLKSAKNLEAAFASEATCKRSASSVNNVQNGRFHLDC